jgi:hypothetical protein
MQYKILTLLQLSLLGMFGINMQCIGQCRLHRLVGMEIWLLEIQMKYCIAVLLLFLILSFLPIILTVFGKLLEMLHNILINTNKIGQISN